MGKQRLERRKRQQNKKREPQQTEYKRKKIKHPLLNFYDKNYKKLLIIPFVLLFLALVQIGYQDATTGDFLNKDVSLRGGLTLTIPVESEINIVDLEERILEVFPGVDFNIRALGTGIGGTSAIMVQSDTTGEQERDEFIQTLTELTGVARQEMNVDMMGPALGESFFRQTIIAVFVAFLLMGLVVYLYFRKLVPSGAVMLKAFSNIAITIAIVNMLGISVSTAGVAAFLMIIGYSIDTDILLATRLLREKDGSVFSRIIGAAKTGLTMTFSTMVALMVAVIASQSAVLTQIMVILLIGLCVDIMNTWIQNAGILRLYVEKQGVE